jgi:DNA gyrase/topoisomerase IV subunit A
MLSSENKIIRYPLQDISVMGRTGRGVTGMKFDGHIVDITCKDGFLLVMDDKGVVKAKDLSEFKEQKRAGKGVWVHGKSGVELVYGTFVPELLGELVIHKKSSEEVLNLEEYSNRLLGEKGYKAFKLLKSDPLINGYLRR